MALPARPPAQKSTNDLLRDEYQDMAVYALECYYSKNLGSGTGLLVLNQAQLIKDRMPPQGLKALAAFTAYIDPSYIRRLNDRSIYEPYCSIGLSDPDRSRLASLLKLHLDCQGPCKQYNDVWGTTLEEEEFKAMVDKAFRAMGEYVFSLFYS